MIWNLKRKNRIGLQPWLFVVVLLIASVSSSYAQQITGSIDGTAKDEQGALVANATVTATNVTTGYARITQTGGDGSYNIQYLPVGEYTVTVGIRNRLQEVCAAESGNPGRPDTGVECHVGRRLGDSDRRSYYCSPSGEYRHLGDRSNHLAPGSQQPAIDHPNRVCGNVRNSRCAIQ